MSFKLKIFFIFMSVILFVLSSPVDARAECTQTMTSLKTQMFAESEELFRLKEKAREGIRMPIQLAPTLEPDEIEVGNVRGSILVKGIGVRLTIVPNSNEDNEGDALLIMHSEYFPENAEIMILKKVEVNNRSEVYAMAYFFEEGSQQLNLVFRLPATMAPGLYGTFEATVVDLPVAKKLKH